MKTDQRLANTGVKRRQASAQTRLVEIIENQGKETVRSIKLLSLVKEQKVAAVGNIAENNWSTSSYGINRLRQTNGFWLMLLQAFLKLAERAFLRRPNNHHLIAPQLHIHTTISAMIAWQMMIWVTMIL